MKAYNYFLIHKMTKYTARVLRQLLADNNIVIPTTTKSKTELFLMLFDAGILKTEKRCFHQEKKRLKNSQK